MTSNMSLSRQAYVSGLHHVALRCRDSEKTRQFYQDFLGLELSVAIPFVAKQTQCAVLHTFYRIGESSFLAFFEAPDIPFEFKQQDDLDLHVAIQSTAASIKEIKHHAKKLGRECRGPVNHGFVESIYLRDPDGYVVEFTAKLATHDVQTDPTRNNAKEVLAQWIKCRSTHVKQSNTPER